MSTKVKIVIAVPSSGRFVPFQWAMALGNFKTPFNTATTQITAFSKDRGACRDALVDAAIQLGAEYLFFLDDDTVPPPNVLPLLAQELDQDPEAMVCGGIYVSKTDPVSPLVFLERGSGPCWTWKYGDVFPCNVVATGSMMIRLSVFQKISKPYFKDLVWKSTEGPRPDPIIPDDVNEINLSDDVYFCRKLEAIGAKVLAHGGVLPVHFSPGKKPFVLPDNSPPLRGTDPKTLWYRQMLEPYGM